MHHAQRTRQSSDFDGVCKYRRTCSQGSSAAQNRQGYPTDIRKAIYTTNAIESLNMSLRKVTKNRGHFPSDEAMFKLLYLALINIAKKWTMHISAWKAALTRFAILFEDRMH
jgi:transposase-like protein